GAHHAPRLPQAARAGGGVCAAVPHGAAAVRSVSARPHAQHPPLDSAGSAVAAALRAGQADADPVPRVLPRNPAAADPAVGHAGADRAVPGGDLRPGRGRARFGDHAGPGLDRRRDALRRWIELALAGLWRGRQPAGAVPAGISCRLPARAHPRVSAPLARGAGRGVPDRAVADRGRQRRMVGRGADERQTEAVLPARGAHGLHFRGGGRSVRQGGQRAAGGGVPVHSLARHADRAARTGRVRALAGRGRDRDGRHPGVDQFQRGHEPGSEQWHSAALHQLRRVVADLFAGGGGRAAQRLPAHGMTRAHTIVIAGGGTGGHLMPGLAVARALAPERPVFIGTARGLEAKLVPAAGFELRLIAIGGLMGTGWRRQTRTLARLPAAVAASARILKEVRAGVVLGIGGYASGPVLMAAGLMRVPIVLLEVNARTGMANRWAARWAKVAAVNFPETARDFRRAEITGIPVRKEFFSLPMPAPNPLPLVLVTGGSQGAHALNQAVRAMAPSVSFGILHQTGTSDAAACASAYAALGGRVSATAFLDDMPAAIAQADLVVCRAGASTLGELAAARRPAILVPFPGAADQHQLR